MSPGTRREADDERAAICRGLEALGLLQFERYVPVLADYCELVRRWNRVTNLVSRRDIGRFVPRHLLDSLSIHPWLTGERVLDFGSGAGLPGLVLALVNPKRQFVLAERKPRKARFLRHASMTLGAANVQVCESLDSFVPDSGVSDSGFHTITSRAVGDSATLWAGLHARLAPGGAMVLMEAASPRGPGSCTARPDRPDSVPDVPGARAKRHWVSLPGITDPHSVLILRKPRESGQQQTPA